MNHFSDQNPYESPIQAELAEPQRSKPKRGGFPIVSAVAFVICLAFTLGNFDPHWATGRDPIANALAFSFGTVALLLLLRLLRWTVAGA